MRILHPEHGSRGTPPHFGVAGLVAHALVRDELQREPHRARMWRRAAGRPDDRTEPPTGAQ